MAAGRYLHELDKEETIARRIRLYFLNEIKICSELLHKETQDNDLNKERRLIIYYQPIFRLPFGIT